MENRRKNLYILPEPLDSKEKLIIDINDIVDFCFCPLYYDIKREIENEISIDALYDITIRQVFYNYLNALQMGTLKETKEFLKYQWGKEWIGYKTKKDLLVTSRPVSNKEYNRWDGRRKIGIKAILNFDDMMENDKQYPIVINHKYEIEIIPNVILTGTFEYIREYTDEENNSSIQIIKFIDYQERSNSKHAILNNIESIAMAYAFEELFKPTNYTNIMMDINNKRIYQNNFNNKHFKLLKDTVKSAIISMQNNLNCVSIDQRCYGCEYRRQCSKKINI